MVDQPKLAEKIGEALKERGMTMKAASLGAGLGETFVRDVIRRGRMPSAANLERIAAALGVSSNWLLNDVGDLPAPAQSEAPRPKSNVSFPPRYQEFNGDRGIPLLGRASMGPNGRFIMNGQKIGEVFTPPNLVGVEGAYATQVFGTSMEPVFRAGQTVWINPHKAVRAEDRVIVQILTDEENTFDSYLKEFVSQTATTLKLKQYNPGEGEEPIITLPADKVFSVHKVVFAEFV